MKSDPLYISDEELTVYYDGKAQYRMNRRLLDRQNCWENLKEIIETHQFKLAVYDLIRETDDKELLASYAKDLQEIEFRLQELWGFERNANFHRFWEYPKCTCPKLDNMDWYPHRQVISAECPLHGAEMAKAIANINDSQKDALPDEVAAPGSVSLLQRFFGLFK